MLIGSTDITDYICCCTATINRCLLVDTAMPWSIAHPSPQKGHGSLHPAPSTRSTGWPTCCAFGSLGLGLVLGGFLLHPCQWVAFENPRPWESESGWMLQPWLQPVRIPDCLTSHCNWCFNYEYVGKLWSPLGDCQGLSLCCSDRSQVGHLNIVLNHRQSSLTAKQEYKLTWIRLYTTWTG
jgi:hypothetical protein